MKASEWSDQLVPLAPVHFFALQVDCFHGKSLKKEHQLPDLSSFHGDRPFAAVSLGWHEDGITLTVEIKGAFDQPQFPDFQSGDSIEFFFDTRDVKTTGYNTRFCHHFYFLPEPFETNDEVVQAGEVTRFRTEDLHDLCDPFLLRVEKKRDFLQIFIPAECLYGYDPSQFDRLGFTYRINRADGNKQFFSVNEEDFSMEQQPSLWASLKLVKS